MVFGILLGILAGPIRVLLKQSLASFRTIAQFVVAFLVFVASIALAHAPFANSLFEGTMVDAVMAALRTRYASESELLADPTGASLLSEEQLSKKATGYTAIVSLGCALLCALLVFPTFQWTKAFYETVLSPALAAPRAAALALLDSSPGASSPSSSAPRGALPRKAMLALGFLAPFLSFLLLTPLAFSSFPLSERLVLCAPAAFRDCLMAPNPERPAGALEVVPARSLSLGSLFGTGDAEAFLTESQWLAVRLLLVAALAVLQVLTTRSATQAFLCTGKEQQVTILLEAAATPELVSTAVEVEAAAVASGSIAPYQRLNSLITRLEFARLRVVLGVAIHVMSLLLVPFATLALATLAYRRGGANLGLSDQLNGWARAATGRSLPGMLGLEKEGAAAAAAASAAGLVDGMSTEAAFSMAFGKENTAFVSLLLSPSVLRHVLLYILGFLMLVLSIAAAVSLLYLESLAPAFTNLGSLVAAAANRPAAAAPAPVAAAAPAAAGANKDSKNTKKNK
jgi:hypothetical protein